MKKTIFIFLFLTIKFGYGQQSTIDSLKDIVNQHKVDTNEVKTLVRLSDIYHYSNFDSSIVFFQQGLLLAKKIGYTKGEADCLVWLAIANNAGGKFDQSIQILLRVLDTYTRLRDINGITAAHTILSGTFEGAGDYRSSLVHAFKARELAERNDMKGTILFFGIRITPVILAGIGGTYEQMNMLDSATEYVQKAIAQNLLINGAKWNFPVYVLGNIQAKQRRYKSALENYRAAIPLAVQNGYLKDILDIYNSIAALFTETNTPDSAIYYAKQIFIKQDLVSHANIFLKAYITLASAYKLKGNKDSTLKYIELSNVMKDSIYSKEKQREFQRMIFNEQLRQLELLTEQQQYRNRIKFYLLISGLIVLAIIAFILYRTNNIKKRANLLLQNQKQEIDQQRTKAETALKELRQTQAQLVQREKMASLGELTAGIAHEIQNPLNFVNNFSEVNVELALELKEELNNLDIQSNNKNNLEEIVDDIVKNQEKILNHGKRADAIVKGMLQHSRISTGQKESTDINALANEYLRLSYHGLRTKDKTFNATLQTDFDETIGKINIIPEDIGRVLLNLYNNAFYAITEKKKEAGESYGPAVSVSTKKFGDKVEIKVRDNGKGIPQKNLDKIFQPFFTTKPTGMGTGLGLSLSYDIIKVHGGEIKVETREGESAEFIIQLPITP